MKPIKMRLKLICNVILEWREDPGTFVVVVEELSKQIPNKC